jgi:3-phosphoglycerate kinase
MVTLLEDIPVKGKFVMMRAGLDVPLDAKKDLLDPARVTDDSRIRDIMPTLKFLVEKGAKIVLAAGWCGRPDGVDPDYSMAPVAKKIEQLLSGAQLLRHPVLIAPDCYKDKKPKSVYKNKESVAKIAKSLKEGQVVVLENVRYDAEANANDKGFAAFFASLADAYVNENETQNHRKEATIISTPLMIAEKGGAVVFGFKYRQVLASIGGLKATLEHPGRKSFALGICGKKIESDPGIVSKISVSLELIDKMKKGDTLIIGGGVIYTFLLAEHYRKKIEAKIAEIHAVVREYDEKIIAQAKAEKDADKAAKITEALQKEKSDKLKGMAGITDSEIKSLIGNSYIRWGQEGEQIVFAYNVLAKAREKGIKEIIAYDHVIANALPDKAGLLPKDAEVKLLDGATGIPQGWLGVGEGPKTLEKISAAIKASAIYLQSGPFSIEEPRVEALSKTDFITFEAARICKHKGGLTIGAGGDTVARINTRTAESAFSIITSAGGATLELIESGTSKGKEAVEAAQK